MIKKLILLGFITLSTMAEQKVHREGTEWCDIWIPKATDQNLPRVLLVGDSITKGYYNTVEKSLAGKANCARFATSACVSDPAFFAQLETMFNHYEYEVVHFNNGLHGFGYTEQEYQEAYERALGVIWANAPEVKLILALSTPLLETSKQNNLNPRINERNRIVRELAKKYGAEVNDLHAISIGRPEYYSDPYHYKPVATELQGRQVGKFIEKTLRNTAGSIWPLSFVPREAKVL
ncbi:SGNH/GDSL hydrolase family protein [Akkermansiaceae bacterium]|jgi:lysophospholipase L1-like esterase|nr:SGNH/GDSL hydrolase family protein [Akkermansiaceae bacterium]